MKTTITNPTLLRMLQNHSGIVSTEDFVKEPDGHLFRPGDKAILIGLEDFSEYNGQTIGITNIREDGPFGKAYYIKGEINNVLNWVYEYRLKKEG